MSYSEKDGQVILTLSREDYERVIFRLGMAVGQLVVRGGGDYQMTIRQELEFMDRLNAGNPHYTPYRVEEKKP